MDQLGNTLMKGVFKNQAARQNDNKIGLAKT